MDPAARLHPVSGHPKAVRGLLEDWLGGPADRPLSVRTSGSSGAAKLVALGQEAVRFSATATLERIGGAGQWLLALPVHHVAGLQVMVRSVLGCTDPVLLADHADLATAAKALRHQRRHISVVPTQLRRWLADPQAARALATFDTVLVGGGPAEPGLLTLAREQSVAVVATYGMTETCGGCVYDGVPLDEVRVALDDQGLVRVAGPVLFDEYVGQPDLTAAALSDGWFSTADLGRLDEHGRLEVLGRADDVAVSGGVNVPLAVVRARLGQMPGLAEVSVEAVPDPEWGERVLAVVTLADAAAGPDLAALRDFVAAKHPRSWAPHQLVVRDQLPMLDSGKIDRVALRADLMARR